MQRPDMAFFSEPRKQKMTAALNERACNCGLGLEEAISPVPTVPTAGKLTLSATVSGGELAPYQPTSQTRSEHFGCLKPSAPGKHTYSFCIVGKREIGIRTAIKKLQSESAYQRAR